MSESEEVKVWTTGTLAKAAGVDQSLIRHELRKGNLKGFKLGREWLIGDDEARRWFAARRTREQKT